MKWVTFFSVKKKKRKKVESVKFSKGGKIWHDMKLEKKGLYTLKEGHSL